MSEIVIDPKDIKDVVEMKDSAAPAEKAAAADKAFPAESAFPPADAAQPEGLTEDPFKGTSLESELAPSVPQVQPNAKAEPEAKSSIQAPPPAPEQKTVMIPKSEMLAGLTRDAAKEKESVGKKEEAPRSDKKRDGPTYFELKRDKEKAEAEALVAKAQAAADKADREKVETELKKLRDAGAGKKPEDITVEDLKKLPPNHPVKAGVEKLEERSRKLKELEDKKVEWKLGQKEEEIAGLQQDLDKAKASKSKSNLAGWLAAAAIFILVFFATIAGGTYAYRALSAPQIAEAKAPAIEAEKKPAVAVEAEKKPLALLDDTSHPAPVAPHRTEVVLHSGSVEESLARAEAAYKAADALEAIRPAAEVLKKAVPDEKSDLDSHKRYLDDQQKLFDQVMATVKK